MTLRILAVVLRPALASAQHVTRGHSHEGWKPRDFDGRGD